MPRAGLGLLLLAVTLPAQQYPFVPVANSPKNIEHIMEDRHGRLWISTHDDVLAFDGTRFFSLRGVGLPPLFAMSLSEDDDGGIVICSDQGVHRYSRGKVEHIVSGLFARDAVAVGPSILLVTVSDTGLPPFAAYEIRAVDGRWRASLISGWKTGMHVTRDAASAILFACPGGWCEIPAQSIMKASASSPATPILHESNLDFARVVRDRYGCLWFRSQEAGAYQCPSDPKPISLPASIAGRNVWSGVTESTDGSMVIASVDSLAAGRPGSLQQASPSTGLPAETVSCAIRARDGTIWIGANVGLYRFAHPFRLTYWKSRHGLNWAFARSSGALLAGTSSGVDRLNEEGDWITLPGSREFGSVSALIPQPDGSVYVAIAAKGVAQLRSDGTLAALATAGPGQTVDALARDAEGAVWVGASGIYRLVRTGLDIRLRPDALAIGLQSPVFIANDPSGALWGCSSGVLIRRQDGVWRTIARDTLPRGLCRGLAFGSGGDVWAGYATGLALIHPGKDAIAVVRTFQPGRDFGGPSTFVLGADARRWLWRGSGDGMHVADLTEAQVGIWQHINQTDDIPDPGVNHGSFFADEDGSVWWAAATNVVHFLPPPDLTHPARPPKVFLSGFSEGGGAPRLAETAGAFPSGTRLTVHIASLEFAARDALRVRYRLLPGQKDWREPSGLDLALGAPGWGNYTLEVESRFVMGAWSSAFRRNIIVLRPWWLSWPALLAFAGIGIGGAGGGFTWSKYRKTREQSLLPDLSAWRLEVLSPESQLLGVTLDRRFEVTAMVARGGFATIFKGLDSEAGLACAIKVFRRELADDPWLTRRFQQEVSALEQIRHASVVSFLGHGIAPGGAPYLAMEFIDGGTLRDLLNAGPVPPRRCASLLRQAGEALERIHARGICHRDVKPENLMLRAGAPDGEELVLIDFSIAIVKGRDQTIHGLSRAAGTIYYMAPEQLFGFATPASDVHSLAKVALEMFTGGRLDELLPDASMDLPDRVCELARGLPLRLSAESVRLLGSALHYEPSRRPQTALEFVQPIVRDLSA